MQYKTRAHLLAIKFFSPISTYYGTSSPPPPLRPNHTRPRPCHCANPGDKAASAADSISRTARVTVALSSSAVGRARWTLAGSRRHGLELGLGPEPAGRCYVSCQRVDGTE